MVIDMNEAQVRTVEQLRQVLKGTQAIEFRRAEDDVGRYRWIDAVLRRFDYRRLPRGDRAPVLAYLQRLSGYGRAQITRLVSRWVSGKPLVKNYRAPEHAFARRYTAADVALLAEVDRAMGTLSGPATACVLRRQRDVFADARFARLGSISVAHLYNLRASAGYRQQRVVVSKTQASKAAAIGVRKAPAPEGRPGFIRIDSVHQGDHDGIKGLYHINAVDCVTQWEVVATVRTISEAHLLPVIEQMLAQFPFETLGFHADNPGGGAPTPEQRVRQPPGGPDARQAAYRVHAQPAAAQQRQRPGRDQERRGGAQALRLRAYPSASCQPLQYLLRRVSQPVPELPPTVSVRHRGG